MTKKVHYVCDRCGKEQGKKFDCTINFRDGTDWGDEKFTKDYCFDCYRDIRKHILESGTDDKARLITENQRLKRENERLENLTAQGVHTCSNTCQRPMCALRRENERLKKQLGISD